MFTRCPECRTVFHISAAELRAAEGTVICGSCGVTFDALATLSETRPAEKLPPEEQDASAAPDAPSAPATALTPEEEARDEEDFLEELESLIGVDEPDPGTEHESAPAAGPDSGPDEAPDEEDEPADDDSPMHAEPDEENPRPSLPVKPFEELADDDFPDPDSVFRVDDLPDGTDLPEPGPFVGPADAGEEEEETGNGEGEGAEEQEEDGDERREAGDRTPPPLGVDLDDEPPLLDQADDGPRRRAWPKVLLALLALLLVGGTWAHAQRGTLLRHPTGEALLGPVYRVLGVDATPEWNPADYRAVRWEAVADPERPDRLVVAVEFVNAASYAQPYPIIRVVLEDRFGRRVGRYDFGPEQYLEAHARGSRLRAGGRVRTSVEAPDPDGRADGFRVDFCLEGPGGELACGPELFR